MQARQWHPDDNNIIDGEFPAVVGVVDDPKEVRNVVGAIVAPMSEKPVVPQKSASNVVKGVTERITKVKPEYKPSASLKKRIWHAVNGMKYYVFNRKAIDDWLMTVGAHDDLKSRKWSMERFERAVEQLWKEYKPRYMPEVSVKHEAMDPSKPPRILIADGDRGQVLGLAVMACLEHCIKRKFPQRTTKGRDRFTAMPEVLKGLRCTQHSQFIEGDGKAWDSRCSRDLRNAIENPLIRHVIEYLTKVGFIPPEWADAVKEVITKKKLKLPFRGGATQCSIWVIIDSIRRSGDRGTSILNWIINAVMWAAVLYESPGELFMQDSRRRGTDVWGNVRWTAFALEGDDSGLNTSPPLTDEQIKNVTDDWNSVGHQMKLKFGEEVGEFVGVKLAIDQFGPTGKWMPDIARCFTRGGCSTSGFAAHGARTGDVKKLAQASISYCLSRAHNYSGLSPTISQAFLDRASALSVKHQVEVKLFDDDLLRKHAEDGPDNIVGIIKARNAGYNILDEMDDLKATGFGCTNEEITQFMSMDWERCTREPGASREYLPRSWC